MEKYSFLEVPVCCMVSCFLGVGGGSWSKRWIQPIIITKCFIEQDFVWFTQQNPQC